MVAFEDGATIARKELREAYETHCTDNGAEAFGARRFAGRLREQGVKETTVRVGTRVVDGWKGVRLATEAERVAAGAWGAARRDIGTCSEKSAYPRPTHARVETNRETAPAGPYVPTTGQSDLADYLEREGVR
jgi:hypothetical protein